jgi:hypothetical protein
MLARLDIRLWTLSFLIIFGGSSWAAKTPDKKAIYAARVKASHWMATMINGLPKTATELDDKLTPLMSDRDRVEFRKQLKGLSSAKSKKLTAYNILDMLVIQQGNRRLYIRKSEALENAIIINGGFKYTYKPKDVFRTLKMAKQPSKSAGIFSDLFLNLAHATEPDVMDVFGAFSYGIRGVVEAEIYALDYASSTNYFLTRRVMPYQLNELKAGDKIEGKSPDVPHISPHPDNTTMLSEQALKSIGVKMPIDKSLFECRKSAEPVQERSIPFEGAPENPWIFETRVTLAGKETRIHFHENEMTLEQSNDQFKTISKSAGVKYIWGLSPPAQYYYSEVMKSQDLDEKTAENLAYLSSSSVFGIAHGCAKGCEQPQLGAFEIFSSKTPTETLKDFASKGLLETMRIKTPRDLDRDPTELENQMQSLLMFATVMKGQCYRQSQNHPGEAKFNLDPKLHEKVTLPGAQDAAE